MQAWNPLTRDPRFMEPWKARMGKWVDIPVQKLSMAGAERVPPAPWVKIMVGEVEGAE
jgi:hypothetical protein